MIKVTVKKRDLEDFSRKLAISGTKLERIDDEIAPMVGETVKQLIVSEMMDRSQSGSDSDQRFWEFMLARTDITVTWASGKVIVSINGLPEGEVENAEDTRSGGKVSATTNLWARHEFGAVFDKTTGKLSYTKDDAGGITVVASGKSGGSVSSRKGSIDKLVRSIRTQIEVAAVASIKLAGELAVKNVVEEATGQKVDIDKSAVPVLARAGVSKAALVAVGISGVKVSPTGQVLLFEKSTSGSYRFSGRKGLGIPTTISR